MKPLPPVRIAHPHVIVDEVVDGSPLVEGTRIPVRRLFAWHRQGTTCEALFRRYPTLGWAKLLDALAFAYDNTDLIVADLQRERESELRCLSWPESINEPAAGCSCARCRALRLREAT